MQNSVSKSLFTNVSTFGDLLEVIMPLFKMKAWS